MKVRFFTPVVHVKNLEQALQNVDICRAAEVDGIFLINHGIPARKLITIAHKVRELHPKMWIGINLLGTDDFSESPVILPELPRIQGYWMDNPGLVEGSQTQTMTDYVVAMVREYQPGALLFGGVAFKYQPQPKDLAEMSKLAAKHIDVITTTGDATGVAASATKIRQMRQAIGSHPLAIASGIDLTNVRFTLPYNNWFMAATKISIDEFHLDPALVKQMRDIIAAANFCPDCGAEPGAPHNDGCDVERCGDCGKQRMGCDCPNPEPVKWTGDWPGFAEAIKFNFWAKWTSTGWTPCDVSDPVAVPDLNRLATHTVWNKVTRQRELR